MSKAAHTPGPHYALNYAGYICMQNVPHYLTDGKHEGLDLLNADDVGMESAEANGSLYASATDLLAQKQELVTRLYNLVNEAKTVMLDLEQFVSTDDVPTSGLNFRITEAEETLNKVTPK